MKRAVFALILVVSSVAGFSQVRLPRIFGDHMVLQRAKPINVWGWATPKEKVTVRLHDQTKTAVADKSGKWMVALAPETAGGPYELLVKGKSTSVAFKDVLVGEVWVCSGQSNMEWPLAVTDGAEKEIASANYPNIRHIKVPLTVASLPKEDFASGEWEQSSPTTAAHFTAVGYYFAKKVQQELNVPIGLINTTWGGTHSETWTSREAFEASEEFKSMITAMPKLDLDKLAKEQAEKTASKIKALQPTFPPAPNELSTWNSIDLKDESWPTMPVPGLWETSKLPEVDGVVWLRKSFDINAANAGKNATLFAAMIDDSDETYINGVKVGTTTGRWNEPRQYAIGSDVLKVGRNVIAIRVTDTGGGGGIHGSESDLRINVGGKNISLAGDWKFQIESVGGGNVGVGPNDYPTLLYNAMLNPLIPYTIAGALWYQGESNAGRAYQYRKAFPLMITDWRKHWGQGDFPFYFVQLSSYNSGNGDSEKGSTWAELREAQAFTSTTVPNTGMAITVDIGNRDDIHPRNKKDVGERLAALALVSTYGKSQVSNGPLFSKLDVSGTNAKVEFSNAQSGLVVKDKYGYVRGFEIAGDDGKFVPARGFAQGSSVTLSNPSVTKPVYVRYGWADDAGECNVFNVEGFPMQPFRTDSFEGITDKVKFRE